MDDALRYRLIKHLEANPHATQRELADHLGISLGKLNYCLRALMQKGWIKAGRFYRSPRKRKYAYLLTPQGLEAKARLTASFLQVKMKEYDLLRQEIETLHQELRAEKEIRARGESSPVYRLSHLGGEHTVTGSCHLLQAGGLNILVDCGLAQGRDSIRDMADWPVGPQQIHYLFLTHAHLDHCGRLPELVEQGFQGEILCTHPTKVLLAPMLHDALGHQGMGAPERRKILAAIDELTWGFEYGKDFVLKDSIRFRLGRAGHILGSCFIRLEGRNPDFSITFSGDLGATNTPLLSDPDPPEASDLLVLESTYGDRLHEDRNLRLRRLGTILSGALADGGKVFIPAFSLGRTQELLYELDRLFTDPAWRQEFPSLQRDFPVVVDSPLGLQFTKIYEQLSPFWDQEAQDLIVRGDYPLDFKRFYSAAAQREHQRLIEMQGPAVILAGSGMCTGGRIVDHLLSGLEDQRNDLVFVGYQAEGTPGREIMQAGEPPGAMVHLQGQQISMKAKVHVLSGYSAHADQQGLIDWVTAMPAKPGAIKLVHGESEAREALTIKLRERGYVLG